VVRDYRRHYDSEGLKNTLQVGKVEFQERFYASDLIAATNVLDKHLSTEFKNIVFVGHSMGNIISFYVASQIRALSQIGALSEIGALRQIENEVKLVSLLSIAKYELPKMNVSANCVIYHAKFNVISSVSEIKFYLQNHKKQLIKSFYTKRNSICYQLIILIMLCLQTSN
jgi:predicted alpha/beta hydrolase family esterase